jgi:hypothetical protein
VGPVLFLIEASIALYQQSLIELLIPDKHFNSGGSDGSHTSLGITLTLAGEKQFLVASESSRATMASGHITSDIDAENIWA